MIFKESKAVILENLSFNLITEKNAEKNREKLFVKPELSIDQSQLETDFITNFKMVSGEVHLLEKKEKLKDRINHIIKQSGDGPVCCWNTKLLESLELTCESEIANADIGITEADFAIPQSRYGNTCASLRLQ